jgi:two-component system nitrate/nitrite response regulator NarL
LVIAGVKDESESVESYLREGCAGVVMVCNTPDVYRKAVQSAVGGELWAPRKVVAKVLRDMIRLGSESARQLTDRESEILSLIGMGYNNRDIATHLFISKETVRWHVRSLYAKLGLSDRDSAIRYWSLARPK